MEKKNNMPRQIEFREILGLAAKNTTCMLVGAAVLLFWSGCCPKAQIRQGSPKQTLLRYVQHVKAQQADQAWELIATEVKKNLDKEMYKTNIKDLLKTLPPLDRLDELRTEWHLVAEDGSQIVMVHQDDGWRLTTSVLLPYGGATPTQTLEAFLLAIRQGDCEALVRYAPPQIRAKYAASDFEKGCQQQIEALRSIASSIAKEINNVVKLDEHRAVLPYQNNRKVILVKQGPRWYIEDL